MSYRSDFEFFVSVNEADFVFFIAGAGVVDDDGHEAFAEVSEHEEDVVEYLSVIVLCQVVGMIEIGCGNPGIEQAGESTPVVPVDIDAAKGGWRRVLYVPGCGWRDGADVCA